MARLIDADALKQTFQRWANVPEYNEAERHIIRAAMIAVDDCPTIGGWISVKDRLPKENEDVLLAFPMNMAVGFMKDGEWYVNSGCNSYVEVVEEAWDEPPLYWALLPEPPKEVNDAE